jgi:hypothetical protein
MKTVLLFAAALAVIALGVVGCASDTASDNPVVSASAPEAVLKPSSSIGLSTPEMTARELALVRRATARYHRVEEAIEDGYVDIGLFVPQMGWHYLRTDLLDGVFDPEHPELLVYADGANGERRLVAAEFGIPIPASPSAPEGFSGDDDVWDMNTGAGLWTLHAWVWYQNPAGMFNPTNPRLP